MRRKKKLGTIESITLEKGVAEGKCLAKKDDKVIFVEGGAPGDVVDIRLTKNKKSFMEGVVTAVIEPSPLRQDSFCTYFGTCGGCKWQHIQYKEQLNLKNQQVIDNLTRIGKCEPKTWLPIVGSEETEFYRNKLEFTFSTNRWLTKEQIDSGETLERNALGFHIPKRFDKILDIEKCYLQNEPSNAIRNALRKFALENDISFYNIREHIGLLRNIVIRTSSKDQVMVLVQFGEDQPEQIEKVMHFLKNEFPEVYSINYIINLKFNDSYADQEVVHYAGQPYIEEEMEDLTFRVGPKSFFQTNGKQALVLYQHTKALAGLTGNELVYDLYTGTGTIANFVARDAKKVIGVEYIEEAIVDANINAKLNGIENIQFYAGDMKEVLNDAFIADNGKPDVIITDPPRAGMHQDVIDTILRAAPEKIVYVSCNPATQARDIALLSELYRVNTVQPVDMFPHTHHVENICLLEKIVN